MDPVSAIGLAASLLQVIGTLTKTVGYLNDVKNAPRERTQLAQEILTLLSLLMGLKDKVENADPTSSWFSQVRSLGQAGGTLEQYHTTLNALAKLLEPGGALKNVGRKLIWPLDKKRISEALAVIGRLKSLIIIALQEDNLTLSRAIKSDINGLGELSRTIRDDVIKLGGDIEGISQGFARLGIDQRHQEILDWLSPLNPAARHIDILSRSQTGTGQWFLNLESFDRWLYGTENMLCCQGMPGAGKTTLLAITVDHLQRQFGLQENFAILYVYIDYKDQDAQSTASLVGALLRQSLQKRGSLSAEVEALYQRHKSSRTRATADELCEVLCTEMQNFVKVFVLVDAIDEYNGACGDRETFIAPLLKILEQPPARLLITSRHNASIASSFPSSARVEIEAAEADIRKYLESRLSVQSSASFRVKLDSTLRISVIDTLTNNAKGRFLSVRLHLATLAKKQNKRELSKALQTLPQDLDGIYKETIQRIFTQDSDDVDLARSILSWLSLSPEPMKVEELQHALAIEPDTKTFDWEMLIEESILVSVCGGLVTIEDESRIIRLVHHTAQEFLVRCHQEKLESQLDFSAFQHAGLTILVACLTYLQYTVFSEGICQKWECRDSHYHYSGCPCYQRRGIDMGSDGLEYPVIVLQRDCKCTMCSERDAMLFHEYASRNWAHYVPKALEQDQTATRLILQLLGNIQTLLNIMNRSNIVSFSKGRGPTALHVSALIGLSSITKQLLDKAALPVDILNNHGDSALHYAAEEGRDQVVSILLEAGAHIDRQGCEGSTPIHLAVRNGHLSTLQLLLSKKGRTDVEYMHTGYYPLEAAVLEETHAEDAVRLLLDNGAFLRKDSFTALHCAHDENVTKQLIEAGANVNATHYIWGTPLHAAAERGHSSIVRLLLQNGANVHAANHDGQTPLHHVDDMTGRDTARLLVDSGSDVHAIDPFGNTPLHYAARHGWQDATFLVENWADVNAINTNTDDSNIPLLVAAKYGNRKVVQLLLDNGCDRDCFSIEGRNALHYAAEGAFEEIVMLLLEHGVDVKATSELGETPLHIAMRNFNNTGSEHERIRVIKLLVDAGVDSDAVSTYTSRYHHGLSEGTALHVCQENPWIKESWLELEPLFSNARDHSTIWERLNDSNHS